MQQIICLILEKTQSVLFGVKISACIYALVDACFKGNLG